jgi:hypothetical protein
VFSSLAVFLVDNEGGRHHLAGGIKLIAALAFCYSFFAMSGAGAETVFYGFLLIVAGLPVFVYLRTRSRQLPIPNVQLPKKTGPTDG